MARKSLTGVSLKAPFLDVFTQVGQNEAYVPMGQGTNITVNSAQTVILGWVYTPPIDAWVEFNAFIALVQKTDAAYHYSYPSVLITPAPVAGFPATINGPYITQHSAVQTFEGHQSTALWGLAAGIAYTMRVNWNTNGGTWQYHQGASTLRCMGKAWPR